MEITIITAIKGAARMPFTTALQYRALIGSIEVKFRAAPASVVTATTA